jgi:hypothetical protein
VDFWDVTKLLYRRWYFAVPGLMLTAIACAWTMVGVSPNYISTAYVQLAPPVSQPTQPGEQTLDQRNPWIGLGLYNLANAATLTVQQASVVESFKASGLSETFTASLNSSSPLVTFEVTGASQQQAIDTTNALIDRYSASVTDLQVQAYGVNPKDLVVARRIDFGANVQESDGRVKRALVAVAGLGLLLTLAVTIGLDAMLNRRARKRAGLPAGVGLDDLSPVPMDSTAPPGRAPRLHRPAPDGPAQGPQPVSDAGRAAVGGTRSVGAKRTRGTVVKPGEVAVSPPPAIGADGHAADDAHGVASADDSDGAPLVDATVVLPLTHRPTRRHDPNGEKRPR